MPWKTEFALSATEQDALVSLRDHAPKKRTCANAPRRCWRLRTAGRCATRRVKRG